MLHTRPLGAGAPPVSAIGYGGMHLSLVDRPPETDAIRVIHAVLDHGVSLLDTADVYCLDDSDIGHNERLFAKALASWGGSHDHLVVATKAGMTRPGGRWERSGRPEHIRQACERSLAALGVATIDLYQFHAPDRNVPFADSVGAFKQLRDEGKIRHVGLSNVSVAEIEQAREIVPIASVQNRLNPFFREAVQEGVVEHCAAQGIGFIAYSPVGGGRLNKKLPSHSAVAALAERHGASAHQIVLAWVRAQGATVIPIPSARTVEHALDSVRAAAVTLAPDEVAAIERAEFSRA
jgi:aryl-alcohol dehydrogenase-like predicted oxidoreductase